MVISFVQSQFFSCYLLYWCWPRAVECANSFQSFPRSHIFLALVGCVTLSNQGNVPACALARK